MFDQADEIAKEIDSPLVEPTLLLQRRVPATDLSLLGRDNRLPAGTPSKRREKAVIVVLCRNKDLDDIRRTIREFEDRFNRRYLYPYVFINDQPFTSKFMDFVSRSTMAQTEFYLIDEGTWEVPGWINQTAADMARAKMEKDGIIYGGNLNYRHMCRWYSGWFFRHPALAKYDWYWRIEPGVHFYCDINYDPFVYMADNNKHYGFVINLLEIRETIPSLWPMVQLFALKKGIDTSPLLKFFVNEKGEYNGCHFWSNFEIARMDLWRDPLYLEFFDFLDKWGGFYYERWGDAPVHSIYVGLTLRKENVHFFNDIGYKHESFGRCIDEGDLEYICHCPKSEKNFDVSGGSCLGAWLAYQEVDWGVRTCWECELTTAYVKNS
ncbi:nucleotide-diphospho-sugar transferase [Polychytrium aggregatum]|uniref:nucleotide-diphospho-sugar transferase n=1 Tax=Polychytrium aggregatum TaxID=110093 RepID=UPI0022FE2618|nr:nucleotide-diphospho-sugar transferase [Polychytrium aggregatum]KAI9193322.1 nucleotide-diphospho-sugar transferase [Polychytrium aggregatum]